MSGDGLVHHVASPLDIPLQQVKAMESTNCAKNLFKDTPGTSLTFKFILWLVTYLFQKIKETYESGYLSQYSD